MVLILLSLTLLFLISNIRHYCQKLQDEFALLVLLSVLSVEALQIQDAFVLRLYFYSTIHITFAEQDSIFH